MDSPNAIIAARVQTFFAPNRIVGWRRVLGGYTPAERWIAELSDGSSRFVKVGGGARTGEWLRNEYKVYSQLDASFLPQLLGWSDEGGRPFMILEDLSDADWPPPWDDQRIAAVRRSLDLVHATRLDVPRVSAQTANRAGWEEVAKDPWPLLGTGVCSRAWLDAALPTLIPAAKEAPLDGEELVHLDLRSDNVCFFGRRTVLIDWSWAARGNGVLDLAFWAPSLAAEGGPLPDELLPDAPEWAALVSGFIAARAGVTPIRDAARIQAVQIMQLKTALPWAVRALHLPPLDGRPIE